MYTNLCIESFNKRIFILLTKIVQLNPAVTENSDALLRPQFELLQSASVIYFPEEKVLRPWKSPLQCNLRISLSLFRKVPNCIVFTMHLTFNVAPRWTVSPHKWLYHAFRGSWKLLFFLQTWHKPCWFFLLDKTIQQSFAYDAQIRRSMQSVNESGERPRPYRDHRQTPLSILLGKRKVRLGCNTHG